MEPNETKVKHTEREWEKDEAPPEDSCRQVDYGRSGIRVNIGPKGESMCGVYGLNPCDSDPEGDANADRIVATWNACIGINPASVPKLLAACKAALHDLDERFDGTASMTLVMKQLGDSITLAESQG